MHTPRYVYHITSSWKWERARKAGQYAPRSLLREGFLHACSQRLLKYVLQRLFAGKKNLLVLVVDTSKVKAPIRKERGGDGKWYHHLYGELNISAVVGIRKVIWEPKLQLLQLRSSK